MRRSTAASRGGSLSPTTSPLLVGRDARRIEDTRQLYKGAYRRGPVTMNAIAAVTPRCGTSKTLDAPVYQLLAARRAMQYAHGHANGSTETTR